MSGDGDGGSGQQTPGGSGGGGLPTTVFTQDQVNHFAAEAKRGALSSFFKDTLGLDNVPTPDDLKGILGKASEYDKLQDGQKNEVQRLNDQVGELTKKADRVPELEAVVQRQKIAATMKLPVEVWHFVEGKTDDEIKASVDSIKTVMRLKDDETDESGDQDQTPSGTGGRPPAPNPQQGRGGGQPPSKSLAAGAAAYAAKHKKE